MNLSLPQLWEDWTDWVLYFIQQRSLLTYRYISYPLTSKMNKTRHCAGKFRASIRLKCKNKFIIKKVLFSINREFPPSMFFRVDSIPYMTIKRSANVHKRLSTRGTAIRENRHASDFRQDQRPLTPYQSTSQSTHHTIKSPTFPQQDLNLP